MYDKFSLSENDQKFFTELVRDAGDRAKVIQHEGFEVKRKDDTTIVTRADTETQSFILEKLSSEFTDMNFIHEENFDTTVNRISDDTVSAVIDPIDGSAMFSMMLPFWCVSIGIFHGFTPVYGFVYSPGCGMLFRCSDTESFCNDSVICVDKSLTVESETNILCASEVPRTFTLKSPGKIRNFGSTALHACLTADNKRNRVVAFIGSGYLWDWAGAIPILKKAGGNIMSFSGKEVDCRAAVENRYKFPELMIAYSPDEFGPVRSLFNR